MRWAEELLKFLLQNNINIFHCYRQSKIDQAGNPMSFDAAWYNSRIVLQIGFNIDRDPMKRDPPPQAYSNCGDFILSG